MEDDHRQDLLDEVERILLELFAEGLDEADDIKKHMVLHGLDKQRLNIIGGFVLSPVAPMHLSFGIASLNGADQATLLEIDSEKHKPLVITPLASGSDAVN